MRVPPQSDKRRSQLPRDQRQQIAEALLAVAGAWKLGDCRRHGGYRTIANACGVTYEQVRTVRRHLLEWSRAAEEVSA